MASRPSPLLSPPRTKRLRPPRRARIRARAPPRDVGVLELRRVVLHHLDARRVHHQLLIADECGRPHRDLDRVAARRRLRALRGDGDGRGVLGLSRPRAGCTGGRAGWPKEQPGLGLVRGLVQLPRRGRCHRGDRLRRRVTWVAFLNLTFGASTVTPKTTFVAFLIIIVLHGLLNTFGVNLVKVLSQRQRLVAPRRRRRDRGHLAHRARPPPEPVVDVHQLREQHRLDVRWGKHLCLLPRPADGPVHVHRL